MADFKQKCKLCDNILGNKNFKVIEDGAKEIFDILLRKLTLNDIQNVLCTKCSSKLHAALNFKLQCLYTNNTIINFKNPKPVDLKQIYVKKKGSMQGGSKLDDREVCRLCLHPMSGDHKSIQEVPSGIMEIYISEINFDVTTNPVICINCHDALLIHGIFIKNCMNVDRKSYGDAENCGEIFLNNQSIKTEEIEIKSEGTEGEILFQALYEIKKEEHDEWDTSLQTQTDIRHTEESKSLYQLYHRKQIQSTFVNNQTEECSFKATSESPSEAQTTKSDCCGQNSKCRCLTRGLKVQEYQCEKCTYNTKRKNNFLQHQLIHKDPSEVQMYECGECPYRSIHKFTLKKHQLRHKDPSEVRVFKCDECDYKSMQKAHLMKHQLTHKDPSEVKMFKCDKCIFETKHKNSLIRHCLTHEDPAEVKMYGCEKCKFITKHSSNLTTHRLTHTDVSEVKIFKCDKCIFETRYKNNLTIHCLTHGDPTEVRVFQCDECDYKSIRKDHLKLHQLKHKDPSEVKQFKCEKCTFETKYRTSLILHSLTHKDPAEVKMYKCETCKFITKHKGSLMQHRLIHSDPSQVRLFKCDECNYKTIRKSHLTKHQLRHEKKGDLKQYQLTHPNFSEGQTLNGS